MNPPAAPLHNHERRIGFPVFNLLLFVLISGILPLLISKFATRTVPGAFTTWILVSLLTGRLFIYEFMHWRKVIRFEIDAESVAFNTLSDATMRRPVCGDRGLRASTAFGCVTCSARRRPLWMSSTLETSEGNSCCQ